MTPMNIAVIGSLNVDFITRTPRLPEAGETLTATSFNTGFGGKGANQAVACARLSNETTKVSMIGNLGSDSFGKDYVQLLQRESINTDRIRIVDDQKTGIANIIVEESGENRILLATNANHAFSPQESDDWGLVTADDEADIVIFQLEIPIPVVMLNIRRARELNKHVILNPSPAVPFHESIHTCIDTLVVNTTEAALLYGAKYESDPAWLDRAAKHFLGLGVRNTVIITLGADGVFFASKTKQATLPAPAVSVVDTTAAGDTFLGAYAAFLAEHGTQDVKYEKALSFAMAAAALAVGRHGAMDAIPRRHEVSI